MLRLIIRNSILLLFVGNILHAGVTIVGGLSHDRIAIPGEIYQGSFTLRNPDENIQNVRLYQTDYEFFHDGTNTYNQPGQQSRSNATWIDFNPKFVSIPPNSEIVVNYEVFVPEDSVIGTYWSILMVEEVPGSMEDEMAQGVGIRVISRYGIQLATHINQTGLRHLSYIGAKIIIEDDKRYIEVDIKNDGERYLRPFLLVRLFDNQGQFIKNIKSEKLRTYPGTSIRFNCDISDMHIGVYTALLVADCGGNDIYGIKYKLEIEK